MKNSDLRKLSSIRRHLEKKYADFPHNMCEDAAEMVEKRLKIKMIVGSIRDPKTGKYLGEHFWNYNPNTGEFVDITLDQFRELRSFNIGSVTVLHKHSRKAFEIYRPRYASDVESDALPTYI